MYRVFISCIFFLTASLAQATIFQWVDEHGRTHYEQQKPLNKSIKSQKIVILAPKLPKNETAQKSIIDSANEIAESNAARQADIDKKEQIAEEKRQLQIRCQTIKQSLLKLTYGGNRLYKDTDGNYSRQSAEEKTKNRERWNRFINENCR